MPCADSSSSSALLPPNPLIPSLSLSQPAWKLHQLLPLFWHQISPQFSSGTSAKSIMNVFTSSFFLLESHQLSAGQFSPAPANPSLGPGPSSLYLHAAARFIFLKDSSPGTPVLKTIKWLHIAYTKCNSKPSPADPSRPFQPGHSPLPF